MSTDQSDEDVLANRARLFAFARTQAAPGPQQTITPLTLLEATVPATTAPDASDLLSTASGLPRITLDELGVPLDGERQARVGRPDYAVLSTLGEGGMGRVHLARQHSLDREVALKTLKPDAPKAVAVALLREARVTGALEHPGVIPVHLLGVDADGRPMLVMKRVDGVHLGTLLRSPDHDAWRARTGPADRLGVAIEILMHVSLTVAFAHHRGIIHRDIKPENIMVGAFGEVYLLDWGIATTKDDVGDPRAMVGTPAYLAPEMVRGARVDERTDVYLLGATLHEILVGEPRHDGPSLMDVIRAALVSAPVAYGDAVPPELAALANRATDRDPAARPATAEAFRDELADFLKHRSARALSDAALERVERLESTLADAGDGVPTDLAAAYRLATEARFGLVESLRDEPGGVHASGAMERCLSASVELELRQGHVETAEALLREMRAPADDLVARIEMAKERQEARARDRARLEGIARDLDPSVEGRGRLVPLMAMALMVLTIGLSVVLGLIGKPTPVTIVAVAVASMTATLAGLALFRDRWLSHAFNRRMAGLVVTGTCALVVDRLVGLVLGAPLATTLAFDLVLLSAVSATGAVTLFRGLGWCVPIFGAGVVATRIWPDSAPAVFVVSTVLVLGVIAWVLPRESTGAVDGPRPGSS